MLLSDSQVHDVEQWIRSHAVSFECICCARKQWTIQRELAFALTVESGGGRINYLGGYPMVAATCSNCGYTAFFDAIQMRLMARD